MAIEPLGQIVGPQQTDHFFNCPDVIGNARFHRWSRPQRLMDAAEVVVHEVQRDGVSVVFDLLRERIRQASHSANLHSHRQVLTFDIAGRNVSGVRITLDDLLFASGAISVGEFLCGHASITNVNEAAKRQFMDFLEQKFGPRIIALEAAAAAEYGTFRAMLIERYQPKGGWKDKRRVERCMDIMGVDLAIDENDLWIVSQASAHNLTLITMDKMTRLSEALGDIVPIIYWPVDPAEQAVYSAAAMRIHNP